MSGIAPSFHAGPGNAPGPFFARLPPLVWRSLAEGHQVEHFPHAAAQAVAIGFFQFRRAEVGGEVGDRSSCP